MAEHLQVTELHDFGLAALMLRKHADREAIGAALQLPVPAQPACVSGNGLTLIGTGPGTWLAFAEAAQPEWLDQLALKLPGVSISDQSGGYVIFRITGSMARPLLQRGAFIDLAASAFGVGSAATTVIAHIGVVIWQSREAETFHVAVFRSYAESFSEWVRAATLSPTT